MSENLESSIKTLLLKKVFFKESDLFYPFVGIHPQFANHKSDFDAFKEFFDINTEQIAGVGEIGLDPTYVEFNGDSGKEIQKWIFEQMLNLAEQHHKPISIHSRGTVSEILDLLPSYHLDHVAFHWYDGSKKNLRKINDYGYFTSFGPYLLYNLDKQNIFREVDTEFILLETDGPVGYKKCFQEVMTTPSLIITLVYFVSTLLRMPFEETSRLILSNVARFIGR